MVEGALTVWADNHVEADWFQSLNRSFAEANVRILGGRGTNGPLIDGLLQYDRPDIILEWDGQARLVVEKTREVPTGHNVGQRMARLVRAVEERVPAIKFFPFDAMKHGDYANICHLNARLLAAFRQMSAIHDVPMIAVNWPSDRSGELVIDGSEDRQMQNLVGSFVDGGMERWWPEARTAMKLMDREYATRVTVNPKYAELPNSARIMETHDLIVDVERTTRLNGDALRDLLRLDQSVVYTIGMNPAKARRQDPYTGTQFVYDYAECRTGPMVAEKHRNLVLVFPKIRLADWLRMNPNDPARKSSNWYLTANALVFSDGWIPLR